MKNSASLIILTVGFILLSAASAKNNNSNSKQNNFLTIQFQPFVPKPDTRISFSVNDYGDGKSYFWKFGDSTAQVVTRVSACIHSYSKPGAYMVRVNTSDGKSGTEMVMVTK